MKKKTTTTYIENYVWKRNVLNFQSPTDKIKHSTIRVKYVTALFVTTAEGNIQVVDT